MVKLAFGLFLNSAMSQGIQMLTAIVIARLFNPASCGAFSEWLGILNLSVIAVTLRLDAALVNAKSNDDRLECFKYILQIAPVAAMVVLLAICLFNSVLDWKVGAFSMAALGVASYFCAINATLQNYFSLNGEYANLKKVRISTGILVLLFQVVGGFIDANAEGLMVGYLLGQMAPVVMSVRDMNVNWHDYKIKSLLEYVERNRRYLYFSMPGDLINVLINQVPVFFIASKYGYTNAGFYALAVRVVGMPISLVGSSIQEIFKRRAALEYLEFGTCKSAYVKTISILIPISVLTLAPIYIFGDFFIKSIFGDQWMPTAELLIVLLPMFFGRIVFGSVSYITYIAKAQHLDLIWQICLLVTIVVTFYGYNGMYDSVKLFSIEYCIFYFIHGILTYNCATNGEV